MQIHAFVAVLLVAGAAAFMPPAGMQARSLALHAERPLVGEIDKAKQAYEWGAKHARTNDAQPEKKAEKPGIDMDKAARDSAIKNQEVDAAKEGIERRFTAAGDSGKTDGQGNIIGEEKPKGADKKE